MEIDRTFAMPSRWTFEINPIQELLDEEMDEGTWIDPFAGSGTTLVACEKLNREYVGIEMEEEYISIIENRLDEVLNPNKKQIDDAQDSNSKKSLFDY